MVYRYVGLDIKVLCFIIIVCDYVLAVVVVNDQGFVLQFVVVQLFYGCKKGIEVQVQDGLFKYFVLFLDYVRGCQQYKVGKFDLYSVLQYVEGV